MEQEWVPIIANGLFTQPFPARYFAAPLCMAASAYHDRLAQLEELDMEHFTIRGRIRYTSKKKELLDQERGGETFIYTIAPNGSRTLRAHCSIDEGSPRVLRDSITTLNADWKPIYGFVQLSVDDEFVGSSWYRFTDTEAECEGFTVREGRISHRFAIDRPPGLFGTHPIQSDAMHVNCYDLSKGPGDQVVPNFFFCSIHHRGATGPILIKSANMHISYIGEEKVSVGAGTFGAHHFRIGTNADDDYMGTEIHPPYHIWVTADGDYVLLKAHCTGYMQTYYELVEYEKRKNFF